MSRLLRSVKHGIGRLTASADARTAITRLTQVSHKAPTRLLPLGKSSVAKAGAAVCALSNYGGGMLQGDSCELIVSVERGAKLGIMTQGASRIYSQRIPNECRATLQAKVERDGLLVLAPDPCALFANASFAQIQNFQIHPTSSVILIDWFSSGRYRNGEQWAFDKLSSRTTLSWLDDDSDGGDSETSQNAMSTPPTTNTPFLQDAISMNLGDVRRTNNNELDPFGVANFNAFASLILYGTHAESVQHQCEALQDALAAQHTRIRERGEKQHLTTEETKSSSSSNSVAYHIQDLGLSGRVCMGMSRVPLGIQHKSNDNDTEMDAYVVRLAATTNEDIYRIFHHCLVPLEESFGMQFYKDRIRATASEIPKMHPTTANTANWKEGASVVVVNNGHADVGTRGLKDETNTTITQKSPSPSEPSFETSIVDTTADRAMWSAYMLADSSMPTGSFAHSAGVETAAQFGMIQDEQDVQNFVQAATRSTMQVVTPFLIAGHHIAASVQKDTNDASVLLQKWNLLDQQAHAVMATNAPASAASLDQGKSLARVAKQWLKDEERKTKTGGQGHPTAISNVLKCLEQANRHHVGPTMGAVGALLGLDEDQVCRLFGYCVARDMVSAAVRLSLVGPLASVRLLHQVQGSAEDGWKASLKTMEEYPDDEGPLSASAASSPVIEALHPCHELLQVRLFRS